MPWHPDIKILVFLCLVGFVAFLATAAGLASDYWLIYRLSANSTGDHRTNATANVRLETAGVFRVCYRPDALPEDGSRCHNIDVFNTDTQTDSHQYQYVYPVYAKEILVAFSVLVVLGVALIFVAEVLAIICLKLRVKWLYISTAVVFILAGVACTAGLIVFSLRGVQLLSDWPREELGESPYDLVNFGWSFAITWAGAAIALLNSCGYIWLSRRVMDAMM